MKVVDMHCDTISELFKARERGEAGSIFDNQLHIDLNKMKKGDYFLQNLPCLCILEENRIRFIMQ